ncbi:MAG: hypothetical protein WBP11_10205 [Dokdonella sp.]
MRVTHFHASRRALLSNSLALAAGTCLPFNAISAVRPSPIDPLLVLDETLAQLMVDLVFTFSDGNSTLVTRLSRVEAAPQPQHVRKGMIKRAFALEFVPVDGVTSWPQGTYDVENRELGRFDLFVVPQRSGNDQPALLATFNRL